MEAVLGRIAELPQEVQDLLSLRYPKQVMEAQLLARLKSRQNKSPNVQSFKPSPKRSQNSKPLSEDEMLRKIAALPPEVQDLLSLRYPQEVVAANLLKDVEQIIKDSKNLPPSQE